MKRLVANSAILLVILTACAVAGTIYSYSDAVSLQLTDYVLCWQGTSTGSTKKCSFSQISSLIGGGTVTSVAVGTGLSASPSPIVATGTLSLANTAVSPGSYTFGSFTVDAQGRLTAASNGTPVTSVAAGTGLSASPSPIVSTGTLSLANTAVSPGSYTNTNLTVDAQGRITAASNGSAGTGTVTSVAAGTGLSASPSPIVGTGTLSLANTAVSPGTYTNSTITVDQQGRITTASNGSASSTVYGMDTPEAHGAAGDGVTDDTAAINDCIKSLKRCTLSCNKTYLVADTVIVGPAVGLDPEGTYQLFGCGASSIIKVSSTGKTRGVLVGSATGFTTVDVEHLAITSTDSSVTYMLGTLQLIRSKIDDVHVSVSYPAAPTDSCIHFDSTQTSTFTNLRTDSCYGTLGSFHIENYYNANYAANWTADNLSYDTAYGLYIYDPNSSAWGNVFDNMTFQVAQTSVKIIGMNSSTFNSIYTEQNITGIIVGDAGLAKASTYLTFNAPFFNANMPTNRTGRSAMMDIQYGVGIVVNNPKFLGNTVANGAAAVTFDLDTETVNWTGHGLTTDTQKVFFTTSDTLPTGITAGTTYYTVNRGADSFQISSSIGGSPIALSGSPAGNFTGIKSAGGNKWAGIKYGVASMGQANISGTDCSGNLGLAITNTDGSIAGATIINPGTGCTTNSCSYSNGNGAGAVCTMTHDASGRVTSINATSGGSNYTQLGHAAALQYEYADGVTIVGPKFDTQTIAGVSADPIPFGALVVAGPSVNANSNISIINDTCPWGAGGRHVSCDWRSDGTDAQTFTYSYWSGGDLVTGQAKVPAINSLPGAP